MFDVMKIKKDFPIFGVHPNLVYLDSAAMSLKPKVVIDSLVTYYQQYSANVFRGIYKLSEKATKKYEETRRKIARFIDAFSEEEIIFVRNTTEALNLIAYAWGRINIQKGDEIVTTIMEHHSNFVPWQQLAVENGAVFKVINITDDGYLNLMVNKHENKKEKKTDLTNIITKKTKILSLTYISNVLGTINPLKEIITEAKKINPKILVVIDAAQAVPHIKVSVKDLGCDFLAFSGQKMLGPTGVGVLWGKKEVLKEISPFLFGGEMIREVYIDKTIFADVPHKFEAGTPHIAGVIGLGAALEYLNNLGMEIIQKHERKLVEYALKRLKEIKEITIYGPTEVKDRSGVITFNLRGIHAHDVAAFLDNYQICVRSGYHCAMPLHTRLKAPATVRATFYIYNDFNDIDKLIIALKKAKKFFYE